MNGFTVSESDLTVRLGFGVENELLSVANSNSLITNYLPVKQFVQMAGEGGFCVLCTFLLSLCVKIILTILAFFMLPTFVLEAICNIASRMIE